MISGNTNDGVEITGSGTTGNLVAGNFIGTNSSGLAALANEVGVSIVAGASDNTIGGTIDGAGDVISGNSGEGLAIQSTSSTGNVVEGDYIGTDMTGNAALGNYFGIQLSAAGNTIGGTVKGARNIIAGNDGTGDYVAGSQIVFAGNPGYLADDNLIAGNYIGLDANGQALAGSTNAGVFFDELTQGDTTGNTIGGTTAAARNVISGNIDGLFMGGDNGNLVEGNDIGTDPTGTIAIGNGTAANGGDGVLIQGGVGDTIGGATSSARNVISGNVDGIRIENAAAVDNVVEGNYIGTDPTGTIAVPNSDHGVIVIATGGGNTIGGATSLPGTGPGNLIAGNPYGLSITYEPAADVIVGNAVGTITLPGGSSPGNDEGVVVSYSSGTQVGGVNPEYANVISGNGVGLAIGGSGGVVVQGNFIGTNFGGTVAVPNALGISIGAGSTNNTIGGTTAGAGNVIAANTDHGLGFVDGAGIDIDTGGSNLVAGNWIGTNALGSTGLGNYGDGVSVYQSTGNTIGGTVAAAANVISGNDNGVELDDSGQNLVLGNLIGTDTTGTVALDNSGAGVLIDNGSSSNTIGGGTTAAANVISGNTGYGIQVDGATTIGNVVANNWVGTGAPARAQCSTSAARSRSRTARRVLAAWRVSRATSSTRGRSASGTTHPASSRSPGTIRRARPARSTSVSAERSDSQYNQTRGIRHRHAGRHARRRPDRRLLDQPPRGLPGPFLRHSFRRVRDRPVPERRHPLPELRPDQSVPLFDVDFRGGNDHGRRGSWAACARRSRSPTPAATL